MYDIVVNAKEIEIEGSLWRIVEKDRINMGTYLVLYLEVRGSSIFDLTLRIKRESIQASTDDAWILNAIRASLQKLPISDSVNLWL